MPALAPYAVDQLGCGDALLAGATLTRLAGGSLTVAAVVGSAAAAVEAQRLGNAVVGTADLRRSLRRLVATHLTVTDEPRPAVVSQRSDQLHPAHA